MKIKHLGYFPFGLSVLLFVSVCVANDSPNEKLLFSLKKTVVNIIDTIRISDSTIPHDNSIHIKTDTVAYKLKVFSDSSDGSGRSICTFTDRDKLAFTYTLQNNLFCKLIKNASEIETIKRKRYIERLLESSCIDSLKLRDVFEKLNSNIIDSCSLPNNFAWLQRNTFAGISCDFRIKGYSYDSMYNISINDYDSLKLTFKNSNIKIPYSIKIQLKTEIPGFTIYENLPTYFIREAEVIIVGTGVHTFTLSIAHDFKIPDFMVARQRERGPSCKIDNTRLFGFSFQSGSDLPLDSTLTIEILEITAIKSRERIASGQEPLIYGSQTTTVTKPQGKQSTASWERILIFLMSGIIICLLGIILVSDKNKLFIRVKTILFPPKIIDIPPIPQVPKVDGIQDKIVNNALRLIENSYNDSSLDEKKISEELRIPLDKVKQITITHGTAESSKSIGVLEYLHTIRFEKEVEYLFSRDCDKIIKATVQKEAYPKDLPEPPEVTDENVQKILQFFRNNYFYPACSPINKGKPDKKDDFDRASSAISETKIAGKIDIDLQLAKCRLRDYIGKNDKNSEEIYSRPLCRYLKVIRLSIAKKVLDEVHLKKPTFILTNIHKLVGYNEYSSFSGDFKKFFNITPDDV